MTHDRTDVLFVTKAPRPGEVKTRLARDIGDVAAAELHTSFVRTLAATIERFVLRAPESTPRHAVLVRADERHHALLDEHILGSQRVPWQSQVQRGEDLGARLIDACRHRVRDDARSHKLVIIGSDSPTLDVRMLEQAEALLDRHDVVIGPSFDGGYYLIGLARPDMTQVFEQITWSSEVVLAQTLARCKTHGLKPALMEFWYDVDTAQDLDMMRTHLLDYLVASPAAQHYSDVVRQLELLDARTP